MCVFVCVCVCVCVSLCVWLCVGGWVWIDIYIVNVPNCVMIKISL